MFSDVADRELADAPKKVKNLAKQLDPQNTEFIFLTEQAILLADEYLNEKVVGVQKVLF